MPLTPTTDFSALPEWRCHKIVRAAQIQAISGDSFGYVVYLDLPDADEKFVSLSPEVFARSKPSIGDYLVVYDDGYVSWSPKKAFEEGYAKLGGAGAENPDAVRA